MHLHRLKLAALGPFPGTHTIDFDHLTTAGLFLLEGPTGAGKSTLIDAITFALFGKVAGEHASDDRLRSSHAAPNAETYVDLVFETASGVYRVRRSPAYERPKRRGGGTTTQQATVRLWRLGTIDAEVGDLLSIRFGEADREIEKVLGLTRAQFVQTVVLPQGEFAAFLRAKPEDRTDLLQRVFGTEVYDLVQSELAERRRAAERAVVDQQALLYSEVDQLVGGLNQLANEPRTAVAHGDVSATPDAGSGGDEPSRSIADALRSLARTADPASSGLPEFVEALSNRVDHDLAAALADETTAQAAVNEAQASHDSIARNIEILHRRAELHNELSALHANEATVTTTRERLESAQRAEALRPLLAGLEKATQEVASATREQLTARGSLPDHINAPPGTGTALLRESAQELVTRLDGAAETARAAAQQRTDATTLQDTITQRHDELNTITAEAAGLPGRRTVLQSAHDEHARQAAQIGELTVRLSAATQAAEAAQQADQLADDLVVAKQAVTAAEEETAQALTAHEQLQAERVTLPSQRLALQADHAARAEVASNHGALTEQLKAAKKVARAARRATDLQNELDQCVAEVSSRRRVADDAVAVEAAAHLARIAGMAGELAAELEPGRPCQVCGSTEHPAPALADTTDQQTAAEQVEEAVQIRTVAEKQLQEAISATKAVEERLTAAHTAADQLTPDQAKARVADLTTRTADATAALAERDALAVQMVTLDEQIEQAQRDVDAAAGRIAAARDTLQVATSTASTLAERLAARREVAGGCSAEEAAGTAHEFEASLAAARDADVARVQAKTELTALDEEETQLNQRVAALREEIAALESTLSQTHQAAINNEARVAATLATASELLLEVSQDKPTQGVVERRHAEARALVVALTALLDAERAHETALTQLRARTAQLDAEIAGRGYDSVADASAALLDEAEQESLAAELRNHDHERHRVTSALADPALP